MKIFKKSNYKGKHFVIQDEITSEDEAFGGWEVGSITKEGVLNKQFIKNHRANCEYYGIPCIITKDKDLIKAYE